MSLMWDILGPIASAKMRNILAFSRGSPRGLAPVLQSGNAGSIPAPRSNHEGLMKPWFLWWPLPWLANQGLRLRAKQANYVLRDIWP